MSEQRVTAEQRRIISEWALHCCEYCRCQAKFATQSFAIDHIIPRSRGGTTIVDNLALTCPGCNLHKYNKVQGYDAVSDAYLPLFHPRREDGRNISNGMMIVA